MKPLRLSILATLSCLALGACTPTQLAKFNTGVNTAVQDVAATCQAAPALIQAVDAKAPDPTSATGIILADAKASCTADGAIAATLAPKVDASTPGWLTKLLNDLAVAAQVAPLVLPLI